MKKASLINIETAYHEMKELFDRENDSRTNSAGVDLEDLDSIRKALAAVGKIYRASHR